MSSCVASVPKARGGTRLSRTRRETRCGAAPHSRERVMEAFESRRAVKVIVGIQAYDVDLAWNVSYAALRGGASMVDVSCDAKVVAAAREATKDVLPVCASAVEPTAFDVAVEAGASMLEIGNYDGFYSQGIVFSAEEVLRLAVETRERFPHLPLSVTVPHTLPLDEQVALAVKLDQIGVDLIQTEGGTSAQPFAPGTVGLIQKAAPSIAATHAIARAVINARVMCASGLSSVTAPMAMSAGASGIGVGTAVNKLNDPLAMVATVKAIVDAVHGTDLPHNLKTAQDQHLGSLSRE